MQVKTSTPDLGTRLLVILAVAVTLGILGAAVGFAAGPEDARVGEITIRDVISGPNGARLYLNDVREMVQETRSLMAAFGGVGLVVGAGVTAFLTMPGGWDGFLTRLKERRQAEAEAHAAAEREAADAHAKWNAEQREASEARERARAAQMRDIKIPRAMALAFENAGNGDLQAGLERALAAIHDEGRLHRPTPTVVHAKEGPSFGTIFGAVVLGIIVASMLGAFLWVVFLAAFIASLGF